LLGHQTPRFPFIASGYDPSMPHEIIELIEKPHLLIAVLLVGAFVGVLIERFLYEKRRRAWREENRWRWQRKLSGGNIENGPWAPKAGSVVPKQPDAADQLRLVMRANFTIQPLLNKSEARVWRPKPGEGQYRRWQWGQV
jgi:hypothetical protein